MKILQNISYLVRNNQINSYNFLEICSYLVITSIIEHKQQKAMHNCMNRYPLRSCNNFLEFINFFNLNFFNLIEGRILYTDLLRYRWCLTIKVNCQR